MTDRVDAYTPVTAVAPDGARISACSHGGHLLSWRPAASGRGEALDSPGPELLWLSPLAGAAPARRSGAASR